MTCNHNLPIFTCYQCSPSKQISELKEQLSKMRENNRLLMDTLELINTMATDQRKHYSAPGGCSSNSMECTRKLYHQATEFKMVALGALEKLKEKK